MIPEIEIVKNWVDEDMVELSIRVCDGESQFCNKFYVGHRRLAEGVIGLDQFKDQVHGGKYDFTLGEFGPEDAVAFHARLHFHGRGKRTSASRPSHILLILLE